MADPESIARPSTRLVLTSLFRADFVVLVKSRRSLLLSVLLPLIMLLVTARQKTTNHLGGSLFIIGLCIAYGLAGTSLMGYALNQARDRETGVFQRLRVTPVPTWTIMASRLAMQCVANLIIAIVVLIVGGQIHHLSLSAGQYALVFLVSIFAGAVFLSIGQALVGLVKSADTINAATRILFIALVFMGLFGESGVLGSTWASISRWTPVGAVMTLFAAVLNISSWDARDSFTVLACFGYVAVFAAVGIRWFQWDAR